MNIIQRHVEIYSFYNIPIQVPHPCVFALVKILVSNRRKGAFAYKAEKDREMAFSIFEYLQEARPKILKDCKTIEVDFSLKLQKEILTITTKYYLELLPVIQQIFPKV
jgi:hypothetical protein